MKQSILDLLKDKEGRWSLRELATALFLALILLSWFAATFFSLRVPEYMFITFSTLIGVALFGYSLEKKAKP